jgi:hypothetical protein
MMLVEGAVIGGDVIKSVVKVAVALVVVCRTPSDLAAARGEPAARRGELCKAG